VLSAVTGVDRLIRVEHPSELREVRRHLLVHELSATVALAGRHHVGRLDCCNLHHDPSGGNVLGRTKTRGLDP
jgi:hypothetical protein